MRTLIRSFFLLFSMHVEIQAAGDPYEQSLNRYVTFLNHSVEEVTDRFQFTKAYYEAVTSYRNLPGAGLRTPSSRTLEEYDYTNAINKSTLPATETKELNAGAKKLWQLVEELDGQCKAIETYIRLEDYQRDGLKQSDVLLAKIQALFLQFSRGKEAFQHQIEAIYQRHNPDARANAYRMKQAEMRQVLEREKKLLQSWNYYLNEAKPADWPLALVQQSVQENESALPAFRQAPSAIQYPASSMLAAFGAAIESMQQAKRSAIDDFTFEARQSAKHGNETYLSLINYYNNDLLANYEAYVRYSAVAHQLLDYPKFSPVFEFDPPRPTTAEHPTEPFKEAPLLAFKTKPAAAPASKTTFEALNNYVEFINESLRQTNTLQILLRNYGSAADSYRDPAGLSRRSGLTYSHQEFKVPVSRYQQVVSGNQHLPLAYRASVQAQAEVLMNMLKEMDALSIELIRYAQTRRYEQDQMRRSDAILERYATLFDTFDQKKEQLYRDVRRIHESYPAANPTDPWHVSGKALLEALDNNKAVLFGVKAYLKGEKDNPPSAAALEASARQLITDEYRNLKGLTRIGRNNGLCPYSPYEDIAENSRRLATKVNQLPRSSDDYEDFYYFYNNELIYEYNKFSELAKAGVLKNINQPNLFILPKIVRRVPERKEPTDKKVLIPPNEPITKSDTGKSVVTPTVPVQEPTPTAKSGKTETLRRDTVYVERERVDTVYIERGNEGENFYSLKGYAANNLVLLLDVSASMNAPDKMPLLKKSVKSLLQLMRPEDEVSIVVYSGKAKVALEPTSGSEQDKIVHAIDELRSDGGTDGNAGIRLAYKVANKNYLRGGNNRIVLATDGEFPVSNQLLAMVEANARQDVYLTVFNFNRNTSVAGSMQQLAEKGRGSYEHITRENANRKLVTEAKARKEN